MRRPAAIDDAFVFSLAVLMLLGVGGLIALALTWRGSAERVLVAEQVPFLVSGGFGGVAVLGFALGVLCIQSRRWVEARRRAELDRIVRAATELLAAVRSENDELRP